jgi:GT2 family glycosyltransferase
LNVVGYHGNSDDQRQAPAARGARPKALAGADLTVTVTIPTRNRGDLVALTLQALMRLRYPLLEILVVDQSTDEVTRQVVANACASDPRVRYYASATTGSSAARNVGMYASDTDIVAYTDDDCIVSEEWLTAILDELRDPAVAGVYGRLIPYEAKARTGTEVGLKDAPIRAEFVAKTPPWHIGHGGNMAFRRTALLALEGFDPLLGAGSLLRSGEDADIAYRLLAAKQRLVYCPGALAYHKHWKTWRDQKQMERSYGVGVGAQVAKHLRCGDLYALPMLVLWVHELGIRRLGAGLLKWHSRKVMYLGYCQLVYPWIGIWRSLRYRIDRRHVRYLPPPDYVLAVTELRGRQNAEARHGAAPPRTTGGQQ